MLNLKPSKFREKICEKVHNVGLRKVFLMNTKPEAMMYKTDKFDEEKTKLIYCKSIQH